MSELQDFLDGIVLLGFDGAEYRVIGVDENGTLIAVMKGDYLGTLRTVRVDADGRLSAFVVDSQDAWQNIVEVGNAELAARLGSPVTYDRRGQVMLMETFEHGLGRWYQVIGDGGAAIALDTTKWSSKGYSVKLSHGVGAGGIATIGWRRGVLPTGLWGCSFNWYTDDDQARWILYFVLLDGVELNGGGIEYQADTGNLIVYTGESGEVVVGQPGVLIETPYGFNTVKVVIDLDTNKYVRLQMNGVEYDVSAYDLYVTGDGTPPLVSVVIESGHETDGAVDIWIDDVIVTVAEPT